MPTGILARNTKNSINKITGIYTNLNIHIIMPPQGQAIRLSHWINPKTIIETQTPPDSVHVPPFLLCLHPEFNGGVVFHVELPQSSNYWVLPSPLAVPSDGIHGTVGGFGPAIRALEWVSPFSSPTPSSLLIPELSCSFKTSPTCCCSPFVPYPSSSTVWFTTWYEFNTRPWYNSNKLCK